MYKHKQNIAMSILMTVLAIMSLLCISDLEASAVPASGGISVLEPSYQVPLGHGAAVAAIAVDPDERILFSVDQRGLVKGWEVGSGKLFGTYPTACRSPQQIVAVRGVSQNDIELKLLCKGSMIAGHFSSSGGFRDFVPRPWSEALKSGLSDSRHDERLLVGEGVAIRSRATGEVVLLDGTNGIVRWRASLGDVSLVRAAADPAGKSLALRSRDAKQVLIVDGVSGKRKSTSVRMETREETEVRRLGFSANGACLAVAVSAELSSDYVTVHALDAGCEGGVFRQSLFLNAVVPILSGRELLLGRKERIARRAPQGDPAFFTSPLESLSALAFSPDGATLTIGGSKSVWAYNLAQNRWQPMIGVVEGADLLALSASGREVLATGSSSLTAWNATTGELLAKHASPKGHMYSISAVGAVGESPPGVWLRSERQLSFWPYQGPIAELPADDALRRLSAHSAPMTWSISLDGRVVAGVDSGGDLVVWQREGEKEVARIRPSARVEAVTLSFDKRLLAYTTTDALTSVVTLSDGQLLSHWRESEGQESRIERLEFSRDGVHLFALSGARLSVRVAATGALSARFTDLDEDARAASRFALSPDERQVALLSSDGTVGLWDWPQGKLRLSLAVLGPGEAVSLGEGKVVAATGPNTRVYLGLEDSGVIKLSEPLSHVGQVRPDSGPRESGSPIALFFDGLPQTSDSPLVWADLRLTGRTVPPARYEVSINGVVQPQLHACGQPITPALRQGIPLRLSAEVNDVRVRAMDSDGRVLAQTNATVNLIGAIGPVAISATLVVQQGLRDQPFHLFLSKDERLLLAERQKEVVVLNAVDGRELRRIALGEGSKSLFRRIDFFDSDRHFVGPGPFPSTLAVWDADTGRPILVRTLKAPVDTMLASPAGSCLAVVEEAVPGIQLMDAELNPVARLVLPTSTSLRNTEETLGEAVGLSFSVDGQRLLVTYLFGGIAVWDVPRRKLIAFKRAPSRGSFFRDAIFAPDGTILTLGFSGRLERWNTDLTSVLAVAERDYPHLYTASLTATNEGIWLGRNDGASLLDDRLKMQARFPPAGSELAVTKGGASIIAKGIDGTLGRWDWPQQSLRWRKYSRDYFFSAMEVSRDGRQVLTRAEASGSQAGQEITFQLWDLEAGRPTMTIRKPQAQGSRRTTSVISPNGEWLASGDDLGEIRVWRTHSGEQIFHQVLKGQGVLALAFDDVGDTLMAATADAGIMKPLLAAWDQVALRRKLDMEFALDETVEKAYRAAMAKGTPRLMTLQLDVRKPHWTSERPLSVRPAQLVADPTQKRWAVRGLGGELLIVDDQKEKRLGRVPVFSVSDLRFSPTGRGLIATDHEGATVWQWEDSTGPAEIRVSASEGSRNFAAAWTADGESVLTSDSRNVFKQLDLVQTKAEPGISLGADENVLAVSTGGRTILLGNASTVRILDRSGHETGRIRGATGRVRPRAWLSPDGAHVVIATARGLGLFDTKGEARGDITVETLSKSSFPRFSADSHFLYVETRRTSDRQVAEVDLSTASIVRMLQPAEKLTSFTVSDDRQILFIGSATGYVSVQSMTDGRSLQRFKLTDAEIKAMDVSADGKLLLIGYSKRLAIWNLADRRMLSTGDRPVHFLGDHGKRIRFAADGWSVITSDLSLDPSRQDLSSRARSIVERRNFSTWAVTDTYRGQFSESHERAVVGVVSEDGATLAWVDEAGRLRLKDFVAEAGDRPSLAEGLREFWPLPQRGLVLGLDERGVAGVWRIADGQRLLTWLAQADGGWLMVDEQGRFDAANLDVAPDAHWVLGANPRETASVEIFMRDYYEPRLLPRLLSGEKFSSIRPVSELNRAQPKVQVVRVERETGPGSSGDTVSVTVEVSGSSEEFALEGQKQRESGAYDLRLFRDGQLVGKRPAEAGEGVVAGSSAEEELGLWRKQRLVVERKEGKREIVFPGIRLPRKAGVKDVQFSAYAFNEDRVKSETARRPFAIPAELSPRVPRAYIVSVGVNAFEDRARDLSYAVNDAKQLGQELKVRLEAQRNERGQARYEKVVWVELTSEAQDDPQGQRKFTRAQASKAKIRAVLQTLAGQTVKPEELNGVDNAQELGRANPEDLVIIALSTHGEVDDRGRFYLLPQDIGNNPSKQQRLERAISNDELSEWLQGVDAIDLAMIVDACHSAASVQNKEFKPGPMGSRGLGQLAYDKGMRILAATQIDQYALETQKTQLGLLSYALVRDGLDRGEADYKPKDQQIFLSEWLNYASERVPGLYQDWREGKLKGTKKGERLTAPEQHPGETRSLQQPALFDFARGRDVRISRQTDRK